MQPALLIRLRPLGPWRTGSPDGAYDRAEPLFRSDRLYSAVSLAMQQLGWLEEWLEVTSRSARPRVAFSSLFPFQTETLFAPPPATLWPPPSHLVKAPNPAFLAKIRWSAARLVPLGVIESLANAQPILADQWMPDAESACLLRRDRPSSSPFRYATRSSAAVDRITRASAHAEHWSCVEFENGSGLWTLARFDDATSGAEWKERVKAAFRLLADSGFGGRRSSGWGQSAAPEFQDGRWPGLLMPKLASRNAGSSTNGNGHAALYWMLSIYSPSDRDAVDWTSGEYRLASREGRIQSSAGAGTPKKLVRMIVEGSVLAAQSEPVGAAVDVAPDGFAHAVYRSGIALALKLPAVEAGREEAVETPSEEEALEARPCEPPGEPQAVAAVEPEPEAQIAASDEPEPQPESAPEAEAMPDEL
jgi:CRISPR/Cas system CSM-associated protein Csm4 (group 5 of RAMP superfamily)